MVQDETKKKSLLALIEIASNSKYESESEASTSFSLLPLYTSFSLTPPPLLSLLSPILPSSLYNMSQYSSINYKQIIQQQQE